MSPTQYNNKRYVLNLALKTSPIDDAVEGQMLYCHIPTDGYGAVRFTAPGELVELLREFDGRKTVDQVIASAGSPSAKNLQRLIDTFLVPKGVLLDTSRSTLPTRPERGSLRLRRPLLSSETVSRCARPLVPLLKNPIAPVLLALILSTQLAFYAFSPHAFGLNLINTDGWQMTAAILVALFAALCHEFGHAAALLRYGGTRTEIGLGLYLYFPIFYTDVSEVWRFPSRQRLVVDAAGMYFQSIISTLAIWILTYTRDVTWAYVVAFVNLSIYGAFNPFLKMDGYWLAADIFEIRDLRSASWAIIAKILGRSGNQSKAGERLSMSARLMLPVYALLSGAFFLYLVVVVGRQVLFALAPGYPALLYRTLHVITNFTNVSTLANGLIEWFWKTSILAGAFIFAWQSTRTLTDSLTRWIRHKPTWFQTWSIRAGSFALAALGAPLAIFGHEIAHFVVGTLFGVRGLVLQSQSVSFPQEKEFWKLLSLHQWRTASALLPPWRAGIFAAAGPLFSCALTLCSTRLIRARRSLGIAGPFLIGAAIVSCFRLFAPVGFMALHGLVWSLHTPIGLSGGPDEYRLWLVAGFPLLPQIVLESLIYGAGIFTLMRWMQQTRQFALAATALLGATAGTIFLILCG
jgi:putative peptide zinc metalloprotease protein